MVVAPLAAYFSIPRLGVVEGLRPWHSLLELLGLGLGLPFALDLGVTIKVCGGGRAGKCLTGGEGGVQGGEFAPQGDFFASDIADFAGFLHVRAIKIFLPDFKTKVVGLPLLCGKKDGQILQRGLEGWFSCTKIISDIQGKCYKCLGI